MHRIACAGGAAEAESRDGERVGLVGGVSEWQGGASGQRDVVDDSVCGEAGCGCAARVAGRERW